MKSAVNGVLSHVVAVVLLSRSCTLTRDKITQTLSNKYSAQENQCGRTKDLYSLC